MFIVGIDVAKRSHEVTVITSEGQVVQKAFSIRNNCMGYNLMMEKLRKLTNVKSQIVFAVESTAHYWLALYTRLRKDGYKAIVLNPIQTSAMREMSIRKTKTDSKDSSLIAELIRLLENRAPWNLCELCNTAAPVRCIVPSSQFRNSGQIRCRLLPS